MSAGVGALCKTIEAAAVPESASLGWTAWASKPVGLLTAKTTVSVSPGSKPGGTFNVASRAASVTKVIGFHCTAPNATVAPSIASVPPPLVPSVAVPGAVPLIVQRNVRVMRSEEHTSELQSRLHLVCRLLLAKKIYLRGC